MPDREDDHPRPSDDAPTGMKPGREPRAPAPDGGSPTPRPAAQSILQSVLPDGGWEGGGPTRGPAAQSILQRVLPDGGWKGGVKLHELDDEPALPEFKQVAD